MNKKVLKSQLEQYKIFRERLLQDADSYNVNEEINVKHHVELLVKAVNQAIFDLENPLPESFVKSKIQDDIKKFLAIYAQKYRLSYDIDTIEKPTPVHSKQIQYLADKLKEHGGTIEDYLDYIFDNLFERKGITKCIGTSISGFAFQQYILDCKDMIKKNKETALEQTEFTDVMNRYRVLLRLSNSNIRIKAWYKEYKECQIDINEFKKRIVEAEKQYPQSEVNATTTVAQETH